MKGVCKYCVTMRGVLYCGCYPECYEQNNIECRDVKDCPAGYGGIKEEWFAEMEEKERYYEAEEDKYWERMKEENR